MILMINTAFMTANLALSTSKGDFFKDVSAKQGHSESVLPAIETLCEQAGVEIKDVDVVAVVIGPGSFTGLRIGVAIAKALKSVNPKIKFISLSSLQVMAYIIAQHKLSKGKFSCIINALSGLYFVAEFDKNGKALGEERLVEGLKNVKFDKFALKDDLDEEDLQFVEISSKDLLEMAKIEQKNCNFSETLEPKYIRLSQAEDNLLKKNKKSDKFS